MRRFDKTKNIQKVNLLSEQRYLLKEADENQLLTYLKELAPRFKLFVFPNLIQGGRASLLPMWEKAKGNFNGNAGVIGIQKSQGNGYMVHVLAQNREAIDGIFQDLTNKFNASHGGDQSAWNLNKQNGTTSSAGGYENARPVDNEQISIAFLMSIYVP